MDKRGDVKCFLKPANFNLVYHTIERARELDDRYAHTLWSKLSLCLFWME